MVLRPWGEGGVSGVMGQRIGCSSGLDLLGDLIFQDLI